MHSKCSILAKTLALGDPMNRRRSKQIAFHDFPIGFQGTRIFPDVFGKYETNHGDCGGNPGPKFMLLNPN